MHLSVSGGVSVSRQFLPGLATYTCLHAQAAYTGFYGGEIGKVMWSLGRPSAGRPGSGSQNLAIVHTPSLIQCLRVWESIPKK